MSYERLESNEDGYVLDEAHPNVAIKIIVKRCLQGLCFIGILSFSTDLFGKQPQESLEFRAFKATLQPWLSNITIPIRRSPFLMKNDPDNCICEIKNVTCTNEDFQFYINDELTCN